MSVFTDCTCGGPRRPDGDGDRWWVVCVRCGRCTPVEPANTDAEWRRKVRIVAALDRAGEL